MAVGGGSGAGGGGGGGLFHYGRESDILRAPHEGKPLVPAQQLAGMISTFPFQSAGGSAAPSACAARIQMRLNSSDKPVS